MIANSFMRKKVVGIIPARMASKRLPGKPLVDICGKPMIWWVYQSAKKVEELVEVYVATPDEIIAEKCKELGMGYIMTGEHLTCHDRVAEVAEKIDADLYVNIQGDSPLLGPETIRKVIEPFLQEEDIQVTCLTVKIKNKEELTNMNVVQLVLGKNNNVIYISRLPIPYDKGNYNPIYYKEAGIYCCTRDNLLKYLALERGSLEKAEECHMLRYIEHGIPIRAVEVEESTISVDTPEDLEKVRRIMEEKLKSENI